MIREAEVSDALAMSDVLEKLATAGARTRPADAAFVMAHYIQHPHRVSCHLAEGDDRTIAGFQSLKVADEHNPYGTPAGWGIVGTHVRPSMARRGVGSLLFAKTLDAARKARLPAIEAFIGQRNTGALEYYEAIGFRTLRRAEGAICKVFDL